MKLIWRGITKENAVFSLVLGLCSALAVTTTVESAYMMGLCVIIVLLFSGFVISLIRKFVVESVQIPVYILIIGTFVTIVEMLLKAYLPKIYTLLGIYLPLIVVNCIVLGRSLSVYSKEKVGPSLCDALGIGLGYTFALILIALVREILGNGTITLMDQVSSLTGYREIIQIPTSEYFPISLFKEPAGAFLTLGLLMGIINFIKGKKKGRV